MSEPDPNTIDISNFISDLRAVIDRHAEEAGTALKRISTPDVVRPTTGADQCWIIFLAVHTAIVDWVVASGMCDDKVKASVLVDVGMRTFLDNTRDNILKAEAGKAQPKKPLIHRQ